MCLKYDLRTSKATVFPLSKNPKAETSLQSSVAAYALGPSTSMSVQLSFISGLLRTTEDIRAAPQKQQYSPA